MQEDKDIKIGKPCRKLKYCPYGILIEQFPLPETCEQHELACLFYGHVCPVFFKGVATAFVDEG
jgi:hypothetical protein